MRATSYWLRGGRPDPAVADDVIADRVRSALGPVCKRLDVPHVHVMVRDHIATLHGSVGTDDEAREIEKAVLNVSGVLGFASYVHVGLGPGDHRPSEGSRTARSPAHLRLVEAASHGGVHGAIAERAVRGVLATFVERLPEGEREHLLGHLPADVRALAVPVRRLGTGAGFRTVAELDEALSVATGLSADRAERVARSVLGALKELAPEETGDVAAVLPLQIREFWNAASVA